ncbi:MAG: hypothetical protein ACK40K_03335 [Raineya sp.]
MVERSRNQQEEHASAPLGVLFPLNAPKSSLSVAEMNFMFSVRFGSAQRPKRAPLGVLLSPLNDRK